ncbi:MAG: hypothetical protein AAGH15_17165 [Myxococcota bacterium]
MILIRRALPRLTLASLTLGGCGGDDGSTVERACEARLSCDPDAFRAEYASVEDCVQQALADQAEVAAEYGAACADAFYALAACALPTFEATCETFYYEGPGSECRREYQSVTLNCFDYYYY